ncbi:DgyrCDS5481 [Dimorphilus gyrociliatus]|uniref:DgyrCDS5481 n=1 Tax=Dimorphilus gyrociliatus TaxID=2664684 RepID=A0A7I8VK56_9ANNE|nr:DgyrCDS5481 [Dimorphilus gyrociliatus]
MTMFNYSLFMILISLIGVSYASILSEDDIVKLIGRPGKPLDVSYGEHSVVPGETLEISKTQNEPNIEIGEDDDCYRTLVMFDPDAPSATLPIMAQFRHWLVVNIKGSDMNSGDTKVTYMGPSPPKGTGPHRYIFAVYKQNDCKRTDFSNINKARPKTSVAKLIADYNLNSSPESANVFFAEKK